MFRAAGLVLLPSLVLGEWFLFRGLPSECGQCEFDVDGSGTLTLEADCKPACRNLEMRYRDLKTVPKDIFQIEKFLERNRRITFAENMLKELEPGTFDSMTNLDILVLKYNRFKNIPANLLDGLTKMYLIQLGNNQLTEIPAGFLSPATALQNVDLGSNYIESLDEDIFAGLSDLMGVTLGGNRLTSLPEGLFKDNPLMSDISVGDNKITQLPADIFNGLTRLRTLSMGSNGLTSLPPTLFSNTPALRYLAMAGNMLKTLPAGIFDTATTLMELNLQSNMISHIPTGVFNTMTALRWLDLTDNALTKLPADMFDAHSEWDGVLLTGNPLECKVDFTANIREVPAGYDSLPPCVDRPKCIVSNKGTKDHEVIEVNGERHTPKANIQECNVLCFNTPGCELWTFNTKKNTCAIKKEGPIFAGYIAKENRITGYVQDPSSFVASECGSED